MRSLLILVVGVSAVVGCAVDDIDSTSSEVQLSEIHIKLGVGSDGDGTAEAPFDEIRDAVFPQDLVGPGTTVILHAGTYPATTFGVAFSGDASAHVTVKAAPDETVVFDPGVAGPNGCFAAPQTNACAGETWLSCGHIQDPACEDRDPDDGIDLPAHDDEFISVHEVDETRWGTMLDSGWRLLSYTTLEDLRAENESDLVVPVSDPRPGFVLASDPQTKRLFTYRGPGLWYDRQYERIHVRLSHTRLGPEVGDYLGSTDPEALPMSISNQVAATITASFIDFQDIVFENGGANTVLADRTEVAFDRCAFRGGTEVVRFGSAQHLTVTNSEFTARLGPWVSREDVKAQSDTIRPAALNACVGHANGSSCSFLLCEEAEPTDCIPVAGTCDATVCEDNDTDPDTGNRHIREVGSARPTSAILVATNKTILDLEIASSEFRDGHDGIQIWGTDTHIHHSLFENLNDEAFIVESPGQNGFNVRVHHNLIRSALHVFNHDVSGTTPTSGKRFFYRNIIDQRVPTLGQHLRPGAGDPWRAGTDFKMNQPIGEIYYYQNTLVQADPGPDMLSFAMSDTAGSRPRRYLNNVHVTFDGNVKYYALPTGTHDVFANGNVWSRRRAVVTAPAFTGGSPPGDWEANSLFDVHVKFGNVPDYGAPRRVPFENTDYRLDAAIAGAPCNRGVALLDALEQALPDEVVGDPGAPDPGAIPCGGPPFAVGIGGRFVFPIAGRPRAEAGDYLVSVDSDDDGFSLIQFDAGQSAFTGTPAFSWREGFDSLAVITGQSFTRELSVGSHKFFLTLTDSVATATDMREVTVVDPNPIANLLRNPGFEDSPAVWTFTSGTSVASPAHSGSFAAKLAPLPAGGLRQVAQVIPISRGASIRVSAWFRVASALTSANARIAIDWLSASGGLLSTSTPIDAIISTASFAHRAGTAVAPVAAVSARVRLVRVVGSSGDLLVDDVRARIIDNAVVNAHFEDGKTGWTSSGIPLALTTDPTKVRSGRAALEMLGSGATTPGTDLVNTLVPAAIAGGQVRASAWVKVAGLTQPVTFKVQWFNSTGGSISTTEIDSRQGTTAQFVELTGTPQAPPGAVAAKAVLSLPNTASGTAWVDDVYIQKF
jgi:hypothetical protein